MLDPTAAYDLATAYYDHVYNAAANNAPIDSLWMAYFDAGINAEDELNLMGYGVSLPVLQPDFPTNGTTLREAGEIDYDFHILSADDYVNKHIKPYI